VTPLPPGVERVAQAAAASPFDAAALCAAIDAFVQPVTQHALFTINRLDASALRLTRVYSSDPVAYPPGGGKDKRGTPWGQQVLIDKQPFVGEGVQAIRAFFDDAAAIEALGLRSVLNVPVVEEGACLGTVNLLMRSDRVDGAVRSLGLLAALLAAPALRARTR
jgi:GAF domain-containing protein